MDDQFNELILRLTRGESEAWEIIRFETGQIIEYYANQQNIELLWIANGLLVPDNKEQLFDEVFVQFKTSFLNNKFQSTSFKELKRFILNVAENKTREGFMKFISLLGSNHQKCWWRLDKDLNNKLIYWLVSSKRCSLNTAQEIYNETLEQFSLLLKEKELHFESSKYLKSYIFKIADIKFKETNRLIIKDKTLTASTKNKDLLLIDEEYDLELDQEVAQLIDLLDNEERKILIGYYFYHEKLKDIAKQLKMKEENCRIIKHRAIKKLRNNLNNMNTYNKEIINTITKRVR